MTRRRRLEVTAGVMAYAVGVLAHLLLERAGVSTEYLPIQVIGAVLLGIAVGRWPILLLPLAVGPTLVLGKDLDDSGMPLVVAAATAILLLQVLPAGLGVALRKQASPGLN